MKKFASVLVLALMAVLMLSVFAPALAEEAAAAATDSAIPAKAIAAAIAIAAAAGAGAIAMGNFPSARSDRQHPRQPDDWSGLHRNGYHLRSDCCDSGRFRSVISLSRKGNRRL